MSVDKKIELFAADLFRCLWSKSNLVVSVIPRMSCYGDEKSECSQAVIHAVYCRQQLFRQKLAQDISRDYCTYSRCGIDFYLYLRDNVDLYIPYEEMNVFDKMFMTCAVVLEMGYWCATNDDKMYMYHAPLCWAMFFDTEMKEEFYAGGGWGNLQRYAGSYHTKILSEPFLATFCVQPGDHLNAQELLGASNDYYDLSELFEKFKQRSYERDGEDKISCSKCRPLLVTLNEIVFARDTVTEESKMVEGYLQIFLSMMTYEEMEKLKASVLESAKYEDTDESESAKHEDTEASESAKCEDTEASESAKCEDTEASESAERLDGNQPENTPCSEKEKLTKEKLVEELKIKIYEERLKALATAELIDRIFADLNYNPDEPDCCDDDVLCIFCGRKINQPIKSTKDKHAKEIERIKSAISQTLEEALFKIPAVPETRLSSEVEESQEHGKKVVPKTVAMKPSKSDVELSNARNNADVKDALKMFLTLGIDPAKSSMLTLLKQNASDHLGETENGNLQDVNEDSLPVIPAEAQAEKGAKKKKKSKKKKNKNSKVSQSSL